MRFSALSLFANLALAIVKAVVGVFSGSRALMAAALYSVNDVLSAAIVMVSLKFGRRPADSDHAYGHGKAEFIAIGLVGLILAVGVFFILFYSLIDVIRGVSVGPHFIAVAVAVLSLVVNGMLALKGSCAARMLASPVLHTAAEHLRADAVSSAAVLVGVLGAFLGLHILDRLVAVFEAFHILWLAGTLFGTSIKGLMDTALPEEEIDELHKAVSRVDGVVRVVDVKTRLAGCYAWADVVVALPKGYSVARATEVCDDVRSAVATGLHRPIETQVAFRSVDLDGGTTALAKTGVAHAR